MTDLILYHDGTRIHSSRQDERHCGLLERADARESSERKPDDPKWTGVLGRDLRQLRADWMDGRYDGPDEEPFDEGHCVLQEPTSHEGTGRKSPVKQPGLVQERTGPRT